MKIYNKIEYKLFKIHIENILKNNVNAKIIIRNIEFHYGYYQEYITKKRIKNVLFYINMINNLNSNRSSRIKVSGEEINNICKIFNKN